MPQMFLGKVRGIFIMNNCEECRHMYHMRNGQAKPDTMFCDLYGKANQYCKTVNPYGNCQKFQPVNYTKMDIGVAIQILQTHRPDRPRSTSQRQLQAAIDTVIEYIISSHNR